MRTTLDLPDELLVEAKKRAAEQRTTLKAILSRALAKHLRLETDPEGSRSSGRYLEHGTNASGAEPTPAAEAGVAEPGDDHALAIRLDPTTAALLDARAREARSTPAEIAERLVRRGLAPLPPLDEDPLTDMLGADAYEPSAVDEVVYDNPAAP